MGQLRGHHLDDEADPQAEHFGEEGRLRADVHGQVHQDLLRGERGEGGSARPAPPCQVSSGAGGDSHLSQDGDAGVLLAGLVNQAGELLVGQRPAGAEPEGEAAVPPLVPAPPQRARLLGPGSHSRSDGLLARLRREAHSQVLLVRQQVSAGLGEGPADGSAPGTPSPVS